MVRTAPAGAEVGTQLGRGSAELGRGQQTGSRAERGDGFYQCSNGGLAVGGDEQWRDEHLFPVEKVSSTAFLGARGTVTKEKSK